MNIGQPEDGSDERTNQTDSYKEYKIGNINTPGYIIAHVSDDQSIFQLAVISKGANKANQYQYTLSISFLVYRISVEAGRW